MLSPLSWPSPKRKALRQRQDVCTARLLWLRAGGGARGSPGAPVKQDDTHRRADRGWPPLPLSFPTPIGRVRRAASEQDQPRGRLTLTAPEMFGRLHVLPIAQAFMRDYPLIQVSMLLSTESFHWSTKVSILVSGSRTSPIPRCARSRSATSGVWWSRTPPTSMSMAPRPTRGTLYDITRSRLPTLDPKASDGHLQHRRAR
jgi:hypothetical protein